MIAIGPTIRIQEETEASISEFQSQLQKCYLEIDLEEKNNNLYSAIDSEEKNSSLYLEID